MNKKIVFLDLDKTLIDSSYQLTTDISKEINICKKSGMRIGLCSDTPLIPLKKWSEKLNLNGPIVAELGAIIYFPKEDIKATVNLPHLDFCFIRDNFIKTLLKELPEITIFIGDNTEFIRQDINLDFSEKLFVLVSGYRSKSIAFHVRRFDKKTGKFFKDNKYLKNITDIVKTVIKNSYSIKNFWIDMNFDYGITIIHHKSTDKRNGISAILSEYGLKKVFMIGDSKSDFIGDKRVVQYAVANARDEYKKRCFYISPYKYTRGVGDILMEILKF